MKYQIDPKEFDINFMRENGFVRRKCPSCGSFFWTQNPDQELCGEAPCVDYSFFGKPPTRRRYSLKEMRREFLKFFEDNGHTIIDPYPVVARWRDDLLITIASIADFQPYVTSGLSSPPANPLVVSQPCLRFEDIDKVGYTSGRHMTVFEMGGAHAFNDRRKGEMLYWKDGTIEFHHRFATERLGIKSEAITYKEHFWVGGGNAGPDVEGIIAGLEVSTLVFMMYKVEEDGSLTETPIWTVDTGYGIERWAWLSQGVYNAFETVYDGLYRWIINELGINIDASAMEKFAQRSPLFSEEDLPKLPQILREMDLENYVNDFLRLIRASKLLDHSKAAVMLISDGGVPSNTGEGYLTRMLIRRLFKIVDELELGDEFIYQLFEKQVELWGSDFPRISMVRDIVQEIIEIELKRYREIISNIPKIVESHLKKGYKPDIDLLITLYDSHGIHPDYVKEYLKSSRGVDIDIPFNFTELVAKRHLEKGRDIQRKTTESLEVDAPRTKKLFYTNQYLDEAKAEVKWIKDNLIALDKTVFYPTGGGQVHDIGVLKHSSGEYQVVDVFDVDGVVIHKLDRPFRGVVGDSVELRIDWDRRYRIMKHHTSTHILLAAARKVLGPHIWQTGVIKQPDYAHLDITHYRRPTDKELSMMEEAVNKIIKEDRTVNSYFLDRGVAEKRYGVWIYQGGVVPGEKLRIIEVEDWDVEACGGTHVKSTREIGLFKIVGVEKIQDGVVRLIYKAGEAAEEYLWRMEEELGKVSNLLSTSRDRVAEEVENLLRRNKELESEVRRLKERLIQTNAKLLLENARQVDGKRLIQLFDDDIDQIIKVGEELDKHSKDYIFIGISRSGRGVNIIVRLGDGLLDRYSAEDIAREIGSRILSRFGGKGDRKYFRLGGVPKAETHNLNELLSEIIDDVVGESS